MNYTSCFCSLAAMAICFAGQNINLYKAETRISALTMNNAACKLDYSLQHIRNRFYNCIHHPVSKGLMMLAGWLERRLEITLVMIWRGAHFRCGMMGTPLLSLSPPLFLPQFHKSSPYPPSPISIIGEIPAATATFSAFMDSLRGLDDMFCD